MLKSLQIKRFKSIRALSIECRKVNLFIGPPDTGKSNILESLYFLSRLGWGWGLDASLRLTPNLGFDALFYRQFFDQPIEISLDDLKVQAQIAGPRRNLELRCLPQGSSGSVTFGNTTQMPELKFLRYFAYTSSSEWQYDFPWPDSDRTVLPPHGYNLMYIARHNEKVFEFFKETISDLDWKLRFDQNQKRFVLSDIRADEIIDYNLDLLSDSIKRLLFYGAILLTSENAVLIFDEPDVYAFPPYPKLLGEMIARDASNQFFLSTHNPYFLSAIIEKTPTKDLGLHVCYRDKEGATGAKLLSPDEVGQVIEQGASVFFNLNDYVQT